MRHSQQSAALPREGRRFRCAIYTRKSTEEGLDQAFNSLDAQQEACAAYILSQSGEGWSVAPNRYDDGGYSGGTMERPGLQRLLSDIAAGRVDIVVVYKIDRLTRSLADFAKIVERLDARGASFVSVTQAFNTTTSMGRLTLNVLLSFAQFEREVGAERVRDKIAASRKKGMWMGGCPPLGYDVRDRKLVINDGEAVTIRWLFSRYLELRSLSRLRAEIEDRGIRTKSFIARSGRQFGGQRWYVGPLRHLLRNRVYVGEAIHKTQAWPGEHNAIVDHVTFAAVQAAFDGSRVERQTAIRRSSGLLTGLVWDDAGNRMSPQISRRDGRRAYGYYVSQACLQRRTTKGSLARVSMQHLDQLATKVLELIAPKAAVGNGPAVRGQLNLYDRSDLAQSCATSSADLVRASVIRVVVSCGSIELMIAKASLLPSGSASASRLSRARQALPGAAVVEKDEAVTITLPVCLSRPSAFKGVEGNTPAWARPKQKLDHALVRNLVLAHRCRVEIEVGRVKSVEAAAKLIGISRNNARQVMRLAWLAPDIQIAIIEGRQPLQLDTSYILTETMPEMWAAQRAILKT